MLIDDYKSLSIAERILLVEEIWDSIAEEASIKLTSAQIKLLDGREAESLAGGNSKKTWEEIKKAVISRKKWSIA